MIVIPPIAITDAMLTSSTVVETAPAAYAGGTPYALNDTVSVAGVAGWIGIYKSWQNGNLGNTPASSPSWWAYMGNVYQIYAGGTPYALGDFVEDVVAHMNYQSLQAGNVGHALSAAINPGDIPTVTDWWVKAGPTNKWAMFDLMRSTQTIVPNAMTQVITPGVGVTGIGLHGLIGDSVTVSMTSGGVGVYSHTENLDTREVFDWYDYFFKPFSTKGSLVLLDLPFYANCIITIALSATAGNVGCGTVDIGTYVFIGDVALNAESDALNFSTITRAFDGSLTVLTPRPNVPKTTQQLLLDKSLINSVRAVRDLLAGQPATWAGLVDNGDGYFETLALHAKHNTFRMTLIPDNAIIDLELEEI
jgi:hypothetical protein